MGKYKLKEGCGVHVGPTPTVPGPDGMLPDAPIYKPGDVVESDRDLRVSFPGKFDLVDDSVPVTPAVQPVAPPAPVAPVAPVAPPTPAPGPAGQPDATASFPVAVAAGLIVRGTEADGFQVYEKDMPTVPVQAIPLPRPAMEAFLVDYTK